jgi:hypothetical protein
LDFDEYIGGLLAVLVSLRLLEFEADDQFPTEDDLAFITKASDRAPHLEYFSMWHTKDRYEFGRLMVRAQIGGQWVICDETEFPSQS